MDKFETFTKNLLKWNKTHKLTNYDKEEIKAQIEDSLYPMKFLDTQNIKTALDIGTGAGFPGLILAIAMPHTKWYLAEPLKKRYSFLNYMKIVLGLDNVEVIPKRIEESEIPKAELITSRAVMKTEDILKFAKPHIAKNGKILLYKGSNALEEIKNIKASVYPKGSRNYILIKEI